MPTTPTPSDLARFATTVPDKAFVTDVVPTAGGKLEHVRITNGVVTFEIDTIDGDGKPRTADDINAAIAKCFADQFPGAK